MGVEVRNLAKSFGDAHAVRDISLDVPDGKLLSVLGPSGSGKTTLLRCIAGVELPDAGYIRIGPQTVYDASHGINVPPEERGIGMVFQSNALWPHMTVRKNVAYPLEIRGVSDVDGRVSEVLSLLKMEGLAARYPSEISGGEQQRVALARAIVYRPSLVLLDEPFSNLDMPLRESLRDDLRQLQLKLGTTMIYVTHDRVDALSLGDEVAILSDGKVLAYGPPDFLLRSPPNSYTAKFLGGMLTIEGEASRQMDGILRISTGFGTFDVPSTKAAGKVKLCIPPLASRLVKDKIAASIPGRVAGIARFPSGFSGIRVATEAGTIEVHFEGDAIGFSPGEQVFVGIDPSRCILVDY